MATRRSMIARPIYGREPYRGNRAVASTVNSADEKQNATPSPLSPLGEGRGEGRKGAEEKEKNGSPTLADLLVLADQLPANDKRELLDRLALQHGLKSAPASSDRDLNMWAEAIHGALEASLGGRDGEGAGVLVIRRLVGSRSAWAPVLDFMKASKLAELTVAERQSCYQLLAGLLVEHAQFVARRSGAPLGPKLISSCAGSISGIFDRSFPGYLAAGLARVVARQLTARVPA